MAGYNLKTMYNQITKDDNDETTESLSLPAQGPVYMQHIIAFSFYTKLEQ
jgi:hypothetical protein